MKNILIIFASNGGSTREISHYLSKNLINDTDHVHVCSIKNAENLEDYDLIILGAPMMKVFHPGMQKFVRKHQTLLSTKKTALFITGLRLTDTGESDYIGIPVYKDSGITRNPHRANRLNFIEQKTALSAYLKPILDAYPDFKPSHIAFFGGVLDFRKLKFIQIIFVLFLRQFKYVDKRNWKAIEAWAEILKAGF